MLSCKTIMGEQSSIMWALFLQRFAQPPCVVDFYIERNFRCGADVHPASVLNSGSLNVIRAFEITISIFCPSFVKSSTENDACSG